MSARGGTSAFLDIYCAQCRNWLLLYQKDGPGNLFRLYLDRIHEPENLASLSRTNKSQKFNGLTCTSCGASIGVPMTYEPESRPAFRLIPSTIVKKRSDGTSLVQPDANFKENENEDSES